MPNDISILPSHASCIGASGTYQVGAQMIDYSQVVYPVIRIMPDGSWQPRGTAFAVASTKLATAFHVSGTSDQGLNIVLPRVGSFAEYQDTSDQDMRVIPVSIAAANPVRDVCVLEIAGAKMDFTYALSGSDVAAPGANIVTLGYPHLNFGRMVLTQQQAHVGARILIDNNGVKSKHLVMNTQAREGQSGGPVFNGAMTEVVAMIIGSYSPAGPGASGISLGGVDPATLHQTTHAISAEYIGEML